MENKALWMAKEFSRNEMGGGGDGDGNTRQRRAILNRPAAEGAAEGRVVSLAPGPQGPTHNQPPTTKKTEEQRRSRWGLWIDRPHKSGGIKVKHEGPWSDSQKKFLASAGNKTGHIAS